MKTGQKLAIDDWWSRSHRMQKCIESHICKILKSFCNIDATQMHCQLFLPVFRSQFAISSRHVKLFARIFTARTLVNLVFATRMCARCTTTADSSWRAAKAPVPAIRELADIQLSLFHSFPLSFTLSLFHFVTQAPWQHERVCGALNVEPIL